MGRGCGWNGARGVGWSPAIQAAHATECGVGLQPGAAAGKSQHWVAEFAVLCPGAGAGDHSAGSGKNQAGCNAKGLQFAESSGGGSAVSITKWNLSFSAPYEPRNGAGVAALRRRAHSASCGFGSFASGRGAIGERANRHARSSWGAARSESNGTSIAKAAVK